MSTLITAWKMNITEETAVLAPAMEEKEKEQG